MEKLKDLGRQESVSDCGGKMFVEITDWGIYLIYIRINSGFLGKYFFFQASRFQGLKYFEYSG